MAEDRSTRLRARLTPRVEKARSFFNERLWDLSLAGASRWRRLAYRWLRIGVLVSRGFIKDRCQFLAFALTYMTLLSIVPLLAFAFAVAKGLKAQDRLRPIVEQQLGQGLKEVCDGLLDAVDRTSVTALGALGLFFLLYAVIRGLSTFEHTFNIIWGVRKPRSLVRKFTDYLSVLTVSPILIVIAMGVTGALESSTVVKDVLAFAPVRILARLTPFVVMWAGFTFIYMFLPNTKVRFGSALTGAIIAGTLYQACQWAYFHFQVGLARYNAIYGAFASFPIFMIWLYTAWVIVLVGAEISYAHQHEGTIRLEGLSRAASVAERERQALRVAARIADQFINGGEAWDAESLARSLSIHFRFVMELLDRLVETGILVETAGAVHRYVLARDPDQITAADVVDAIRRHGRALNDGTEDDPQRRTIDRILGKARQAEEDILSRYTLRALAERLDEHVTPDERASEPALP